jgi:hypothetical protein
VAATHIEGFGCRKTLLFHDNSHFFYFTTKGYASYICYMEQAFIHSCHHVLSLLSLFTTTTTTSTTNAYNSALTEADALADSDASLALYELADLEADEALALATEDKLAAESDARE